jgi:hypothetical protein
VLAEVESNFVSVQDLNQKHSVNIMREWRLADESLDRSARRMNIDRRDAAHIAGNTRIWHIRT